MARLATTRIHLMNLCLLHKAESDIMLGLMALEALMALDFDQLEMCVRLGDIESQSRAA